jgi:peptidoglycan-N-acetylglucosamine deacetylase
VELPSDLSLDDWTQYVCLKDFGYMLPIASPQRAMEVFQAEFDAAWKYGALWIAVWHPFVSGRMSRADAIAGLIEHMQKKGGVWFATLEEIAEHTRAFIASGRWTPRVERLPFYERPLSDVVLTGSGVVPG